MRLIDRIASLALGTLALVSITASAGAQEPAACLSANPAAWPSPSRPYFMIAFDTSGSMTTNVATTNSCGYPNNRTGHGRCALKNTVQAFGGTVNFGLASFAWRNECTGAANPNDCPTSGVCSAVYPPGNDNFCGPFLNETTLATNVHSGGHVIVPMLQDHYWALPPAATNVGLISQLGDNSCGINNGVDNGNATWNGELGASSNTPLGGILYDMNRYFAGSYADKWTGTTLASPIGTQVQGERPCRSINVILITDGDETCDQGLSPTPIAGGCRNGFATYLNAGGERLASYEADRLFTTGITIGGQNFKVRTHVIAFTGANTTATDHIAACGGTTASYSTADEDQLSTALANIISSAIKPEVCDNSDNNCNGCTDEGYSHFCNVKPGTCCSWNTLAQKTTCGATACQCCNWTNATQRNTCLTQFQASITAGNPTGDLSLLPCTTPAQQAVPANWLCYDPKESCDNVDNNCASGVDENQTKCGSPLHCPIPETCNGQDDNCDSIVDNATGSGVPFSACPNNCQPSTEICDGCDNDCDGVADDGIPPIACGSTPPANCAGTKSCLSTGQSVPVGGCVGVGVPKGFGNCNNTPQSEICDSLDNDCDGTVDEGIAPVTCTIPGQPGLVYQDTFPLSQCKKGILPCNGTCTGWIGPSSEVCDGIDNDCDGTVDDGVPGVGNVCGSDTGACSKGTTACVGGVLLCQGGTQPQPESCNGIDDDCDGDTDDAPLTDQPAQPGCWNLPATGCNPLCTHQNLSWCPPPGGTCKTTGTLSTPCQTGSLQCDGANKWKCVGGKLPGPEVCDGTDNDCDTQTDESLGPPIGSQCGTDVGECDFGANVCSAGTIECQGGQGPVPETCNAKDDDCDGTIDNGIPIGGSCFPPYDTVAYPGARDKGECKPGVNQCDPGGSGGLICVGGVGPSPEICDGKDNDCDGFVDEPGPPVDGIDGTANPIDPTQHIGDPCGVDTGQCKKGALSCDAGKFVCLGSVGPSPEICDCVDNDCDGTIDDTPEADSGAPTLCSPGKSCVEAAAGVCQCAQPCQGELCPGGTACKNVPKSGSQQSGDYCVSDPCGDCSKKTIKNQQTGDIECAPTGNVPECVCKGNLGCKSPCEGIVCDPGQACAPSGPQAGTCQPENNCYFFGCPTDEACNGGVCVDDPCQPNPCAANEVCKPNAAFTEPRCVGSCAGVSCPSGEECVEGACTGTGCGNDCPPGEVCSPGADAGTCGPSKCQSDGGVACSNGAYCDPETGACGNEPCTAVQCPSAQECVNGECQWTPEGGVGGTGGTGGGTGGSGGGTDASTGGSGGSSTGGSGNVAGSQEKGVWGLATGGGGCACRTTGSRDPLNRAAALLGVLAALGVVFRRRSRKSRETGRTGMRSGRYAWAAAFVMSAAFGMSGTGCSTESFCFSDCEGEGNSGSGGGGKVDSGLGGQINTDGSTGGTGGGINLDAGDACSPNPPELCNGIDDDCNGKIDDTFDFASIVTCGDCDTHCDQLPHTINQTCTPPPNPGSAPGTCTFDCEQDFYDLVDNIPGCEYQCTFNPTGANTTDSGPPNGICGADDDCDGKIDEDLDTCADIENCGKCGRKCSLPNASAKCVTTAVPPDQCVWVSPSSPSNNTDCEIDSCNTGFYDNDGNGANGCEYQCPVATPSAELCDGVDNDCDGLIDNADADLETQDPDVGDVCHGGAQGECATAAHEGKQKCVGGVISCCDQDSDNVDNTNPNFPKNGVRNGVCDSPTGPQVLKPNDVSETCNSLDDDCDGTNDDNPTDAGGACGSSSVGNCQKGTNQCQSGALVCVGNIEPGTEICNGQDDNCDAVIDGIVPAGAPTTCTTSAQCTSSQFCATIGSVKHCVNKPADSIGDCAPPGLQLPVPPPCLKGTLTCSGGVKSCTGYVGPTGPTDACGVDSNCDGSLTGQPNLQTDVKNCGACGNDCNQIAPGGHGVWACQTGTCVRTACDTGFINCDANNNTCEKACTFISAAEQCNGIDDNCNCAIDDAIASVPSPVQVCGVAPAATDPGCVAGAGGVSVACTSGAWSCTFPTGYCTGAAPNYCNATVDSCDGKDNNCNGASDENYKPPILNQGYLGQPCASDDGLPPPGHGVCKGTGSYVCATTTSTSCNAVKDNTQVSAELCDNQDNDCDGSVDEIYTAKGTNATFWVKPAVTHITNTPGNGVWVFQYEATRPGATNVNPGSGNGYHTSAPVGTTLDKTKACSVSGAVPWFNVTGTEVEQTCTAMGARACTTAEWQTACRPNVACTWGYNPRGAAGSACATPLTATKYCNIGSFDFDSGVAGNQDGLLPTGSAALQNCWADWSALLSNPAANNNIRDLTGNLREIVKNATNEYKLLGGAFNSDSEDGSSCGFTFYTVDQSFKLFDTGFRCCFDANPS